MENFDLTKLTESELRELSGKISREILARKNTKKNELAKTIIRAIESYTVEFGDLKIDIEGEDYFYFPDEAKFEFFPDENMITVK